MQILCVFSLFFLRAIAKPITNLNKVPHNSCNFVCLWTVRDALFHSHKQCKEGTKKKKKKKITYQAHRVNVALSARAHACIRFSLTESPNLLTR